MNERTLEALLMSAELSADVVEHRVLEATAGDYRPFPEELAPALKGALERRGIGQLYTHQREVWDHARNGRSVVVVTPTASGKTLCYNLPVLQTLLEERSARALYLFPTKALSQDQQSELNELIIEGELPVKVSTYDGDTPDSLRISARDTGRIIISNPDMLHAGVLPNHPKWIKFFSSLKYIVVDETHTYRGVFGSHVANLLRRLIRVCRFYGADPIFILCSATIGNPGELASSLVERPVTLVDRNGAPRGRKDIILYNPPLVDAVQGIRRSVLTESRKWALAFLRRGIKTILFAHSRVKTEVVASYINDALKNINTDNERTRVEAYRGGLLPNERREIERGLREGDIAGVVSTNALELGIDIGGLDAAVVAGFPGSFNSFWQQAGRAGRRGDTSVVVFIATASPLDQYVMNHSEWFFTRPSEEARINPDNPYILVDHAKCAAFELPFRDGEGFGALPPEELEGILSVLEEDGILRHTGGRWHWADRGYPAEGISLRSASSENVVIVDVTKGRNPVIGEMDRPSAKELLFENAVYIHRGRQYLVETLDIENRKALVREADVNYYTDALVKRDIKPLSEDEEFPYPKGADEHCILKAVLGDVLVRSQVSKFKKIRFHSHENIGYGDIDLPEEELQSRALVLLFPPDTLAGEWLAGRDAAAIGSTLAALGELVARIAPVWLLCDRRDLGTSERVRDGHFALPALYIWDRYPGGTGLSEGLSKHFEDLFASVYETARACPCESGCPSCTGAGTTLSAPASADYSTGVSAKMDILSFLAILAGNRI